jgi:hypothetical protein
MAIIRQIRAAITNIACPAVRPMEIRELKMKTPARVMSTAKIPTKHPFLFIAFLLRKYLKVRLGKFSIEALDQHYRKLL